MIHKRALIIVLGSLTFLFPSCRFGSHLEWYNGIEVVHLEGSPYERGAAYGHLMKKEIRETISRWTGEVENTFGRDPDSVIEEFLASSSYRESIERHDPDLLDEVYGMSESARMDFATLLAFQMSEELFTLLDDESRRKCTSVGRSRTDSTPSILAQNMDPPLFLHGHPLVLHNIPSGGGPESYIFTVPGLLGLAGMNDKGLAVTCMGMTMLNHNTDGLPVISVVRGILSSSTLEEALAFMHEISFAIPQCYGIGGIEGVYCLECSANQVAEFYPFEERDVLLHTNHSINNRDFNDNFVELLKEYDKTIDDPYYCPRYFLAYDRIREYEMKLGFEQIASILRCPEPEIEPILNDHTLGTLIMELDDEPVLRLALGHEPGAVFRNLFFR
jgi:hypothetical protein